MSATTSATNTAAQNGTASYVARAIDLTITLGTGTFGATGQNTVKLSGLRIVANIVKGGFPSMDRAELQVYGVPLAIMQSVSTLGINPAQVRDHNDLLIEAGDAINGMSVVYNGHIQDAWINADDQPETFLGLLCFGAAFQAVAPSPPISFPGGADVATMLSGIAARNGWAFENNGVQVQLSNAYFAGTAVQQWHDIARAANISATFDTGSNTLAICPKFGARGGQIPLISAASGMIGYPKFRDQAMAFRCIFNPSLKLLGQITMQSSIGGAATQAQNTASSNVGGPNGLWVITGPLAYSLASQMPGGPWFCDAVCTRAAGPSR